MNPDRFRRGLGERASTFDGEATSRGGGLPSVTVRQGRGADLSGSTSRGDLDPAELSGPLSRR